MMVITRCSLHQSVPTRCGGCQGVALRTGRYPTRRSVVAPRDEVKHPYTVACEARRLEGTHHQAGETAHSCVAEASRSPSPSVSDADVWLSEAQRGCQARLSEGAPPRAARASPPGIPLASVDLWPYATRCRALPMGEVVCAIPDLRAVGSALLRPRPRAGGSLGRAGPKAHSTVVHGSTMAHTAEAMPPRRPGRQRLAHERSHRYTCLRSRPRTGQCSHAHKDAARLDCPRGPLGCQGTFRPPIGSATRSNGRCALSHLNAPQGAHKEGTGAAALCPCG